MSVVTKILNRRDEKIRRQMRQLDGSFVTVGVHDDAGTYSGVDPENSTTVAQVAFWNHFGTRTIPARPYMSSAVDIGRPKLFKLQDQILNDVVAGRTTVRKGLDKLGFGIANMLQSRIRNAQEWAVPNTLSTINQKLAGGAVRGPVPLIETTLLLRSQTWKTTLKVTA